MIISEQNPTQVVLEILVLNPDGSIKTNVTSAGVRVYHIATGTEVEDLATSSLTQVGTSNTWRYIWTPVALTTNAYIAEYTIIDSDLVTSIIAEDIIIGILEDKIAALQADITLIKQIETGRWKIISNQLILYGPDNTTELVRFNLFDASGAPTNDSPADRIKV